MPPQLHHRHAPAIQAPPPTHDRVAEEARFSGVVRVDVAGEIRMAKAYGFANRACGTANTVDTQFGIASGTKGLTALAVLSLIEHGQLELTTTARSVLGPDLPLVDDNVTVEDLWASPRRADGWL
ncbi:MAG: beta-lactamase family protein [Actinobacteria bacterium]|nr:beta-lactamase family protein [Actinomycetota bacterium]